MFKSSSKFRLAKVLVACVFFVATVVASASVAVANIETTAKEIGGSLSSTVESAVPDFDAEIGSLLDKAKSVIPAEIGKAGSLSEGKAMALLQSAMANVTSAKKEVESAKRTAFNAKEKLTESKEKLAAAQKKLKSAESDLASLTKKYSGLALEVVEKVKGGVGTTLKKTVEDTVQGLSEGESSKSLGDKLPTESVTPGVLKIDIFGSLLRSDLTSEQKLRDAQAKVKTLEAKVKKLKEEVIALEEEVDKNEEEIQLAQADLESAQENLKTAEKELEIAENLVGVFEVELQTPFARSPTEKCGKEDDKYYLDEKTGYLWHCSEGAKKWRQVIRGNDGNAILSNYAGLLYKWLAGIVGIVAVLMIVVGGIQISYAGASQEGLQQGKDRIFAALIGLMLLFLSSLILYTVNPTFFVGL